MDIPAFQLYRGDAASGADLPMRGVGWVLRWTAAIAVLAFASIALTVFALQLSAETALRHAAAAGLREAALPRSTSESVAAAVRQQLAARPRLMRAAQWQLTSNGVPVSGPIRRDAAAQLSLSLGVATRDALPRYLALVAGNSVIRVRVDGPNHLW